MSRPTAFYTSSHGGIYSGLRNLGITDIDTPTLMPWKVGHPRWLRGKEPACQCRRCGFDDWVGNPLEKGMATHSRVFLPGEFHSQRNLAGYTVYSVAKSQTRLSD